MERWTVQVARLGGELGPDPPPDLLPTAATALAWVAVERPGDGEDLDVATDPDIEAAVTALHRLLGRTMRPWCGRNLDRALVGLDPTWAPVHGARLAAALAAGLLAGHLPAGMPWAVHVEDPVGVAGPALRPVLDLLGGLLDGWDPTLAPPAVTTNLGAFVRAGAGYRPAPGRLATVPDLWIELDPTTPAEDPLPEGGDAPLVVVRRAPAGSDDPGIPPATGMPPRPAPALAAVARWCFASGDAPDGDAAVLLDGTFPDGAGWPEEGAGGDDAETDGAPRWAGAWRRDVADLRLAARPEDASALCRRALVEAEHPTGSRRRHARLVQAAAATGEGAEPLRRHARTLRTTARRGWALDVWAVADAALSAQLVADVVQAPADCTPGELGRALAARVEEAARQARAVVSGQTAR